MLFRWFWLFSFLCVGLASRWELARCSWCAPCIRRPARGYDTRLSTGFERGRCVCGFFPVGPALDFSRGFSKRRRRTSGAALVASDSPVGPALTSGRGWRCAHGFCWGTSPGFSICGISTVLRWRFSSYRVWFSFLLPIKIWVIKFPQSFFAYWETCYYEVFIEEFVDKLYIYMIQVYTVKSKSFCWLNIVCDSFCIV